MGEQEVEEVEEEEEEEGGMGGGVLVVMHGRSLMTIDLRIRTMPAWSTSGFHRPGRTTSAKREAP